MESGEDSKNWWDKFIDKADNTVDSLKQKAHEAFQITKDAAIELYGTAKNKAVYVYDSAANWTGETYEKASAKAKELIGDGRQYLEGLTDIDDIQIPDAEDYNPNATAKSELFVPYYISSILSDQGYTVYNGVVYYKNQVYNGLIFTKNEVFIEEDGRQIDSCGFIQLVSDNYSDVRITEDMVDTGLIAIPATSDSEVQAFIVQDHVLLEPFSGIIDNTYFSYKQTSDYVVEISFKTNSQSNYDKTIELYDFDSQKCVYTSQDAQNEIQKLYAENQQAFEAGVGASNSMADFIANNEVEVSSLLVLNNEVLDTLCTTAVHGYTACSAYAEELFEKITDSPLISVDGAGNTYTLESENAVDPVKVANGLVYTVGSAMATIGTVAGAVATIAFCVENGSVVVPVIIITTGTCSVVYNISNILAGAQDVYYGAKGDVTEANNPVLLLFKKAIPDESIATLLYHIWGISNTVITSIMNPVARALSIAKTKGLNVFGTVGTVTRAALTQLAKYAATGVASGLVSNYVYKVVQKVTGSDALATIVRYGSASVVALLTYAGLDQFDRQFNLSGLYPKTVITDSSGIKHYYDNNGNEYRLGSDLKPNSTYQIEGYTYKTDAQGRICSVKGELYLTESQRKPIYDNLDSISKGSQQIGDERGHIIGAQFGGSNGLENLVPMNSHLNRGDYRVFENQLAKQIQAGKTVLVDIEPLYEGNSFRPSEIRFIYIIDGVRNMRVFMNSPA